jgi:hypothetical protein
MSSPLERWSDELVSVVRLHAQGKVTVAEVDRMIERVPHDEPDGVHLVRGQLLVAGHAMVDGNHVLFDHAKDVLTRLPERDRQALGADEILGAYDQLREAFVSHDAVVDAWEHHVGEL